VKFKEAIKYYQDEGLKIDRAKIRVCQDILMLKLNASTYKEHLTFKGGTIMYHLSHNQRRATMDVDMDLITYSIQDKELVELFDNMGSIQDDSKIIFIVDGASIVKLNHDEYEGKSLTLIFFDETDDQLRLRMDIGVHSNLHVQQEKLFFTLSIVNQRVQLLCNSIEQMLVEKTTSFIKRGILSTRIKDIFDVYYLIAHESLNDDIVVYNIHQIIIGRGFSPSVDQYVNDLIEVYNHQTILAKMESSTNWTGANCSEIVTTIITYFNNLFHVKSHISY
jgi:predicted nucleotidyltransferase component of viral defense system